MNVKRLTCWSLAVAFFALGALHASADSQLEMKRHQDGCKTIFPKGRVGPTGAQGPVGAQGPAGAAGTVVNPAYAGGFSGNQSFTNTTPTLFFFTDLYTPLNIAHTNGSTNYTITSPGTYLIEWTVALTPGTNLSLGGNTAPTGDVFAITLKAGQQTIAYPAQFLINLFPVNQITTGTTLSGNISVTLNAGDVVTLSGTSSFATTASPTAGNADLSITKISLP